MEISRVTSPVPMPKPVARSVSESAKQAEAEAGNSLTPSEVAGVQELTPAQQAHPVEQMRENALEENQNSEELEKEVAAINQRLEEMGKASVQFNVDDKSGELIVTVVDRNTDEVIREIPPEEVRQLRARLSEMRGLLVNREG